MIGLLTIRLGDLYVALVTLTFGLLMDNLVFSRNIFLQQGLGVTLNPPKFVHTNKAFTYFALIVFCIIAIFIVNLRRSTTGMALTGVRTSEAGVQDPRCEHPPDEGHHRRTRRVRGRDRRKPAGDAAAGNRAAGQLRDPAGRLWLAVLVTQGIRSNMAALIAGYILHRVPRPDPDLPARPELGEHPPDPVRTGRHRSGQEPRRGAGDAGSTVPRLLARSESRAAQARRRDGRGYHPDRRCCRGGAMTGAEPSLVLRGRGRRVRFGGLTALDSVDVNIARRER